MPVIVVGGLLLVLVPALLVVAARFRPGPSAGTTSSAGRAVPESAWPVYPPGQDRPSAPDFAVGTLDGGRFVLSEQRGRVVVVYFMAGWCLTCVPEARALARLYAEYRDRGLEVLAVDAQFDETPADLERFRRLVGLSPPPDYRWAIDRDLKVVAAFGVRSLDTTIIIDPNGRIAYRDEVPTSYDILKRVVEKILP